MTFDWKMHEKLHRKFAKQFSGKNIKKRLWNIQDQDPEIMKMIIKIMEDVAEEQPQSLGAYLAEHNLLTPG